MRNERRNGKRVKHGKKQFDWKQFANKYKRHGHKHGRKAENVKVFIVFVKEISDCDCKDCNCSDYLDLTKSEKSEKD